ncbi:MAG: histone deacetylase [Planctomycetes bacterium]|nr:histone deacetylase [Planctomycetota bacterium]
MSEIGIVVDDRFKLHDTGDGHPERPARMDAVREGLAEAGLLDELPMIEATPVDMALVERIHTPAYLKRLEDACRRGDSTIDEADCTICPESFEAARRAAGGVVEAARRIGGGMLRRAFCAVRPPGHHCEADRSMGFCLMNNVAIAARVLQDEFGLARILILDWDVHHGNGTQHVFESDPSVLYVSLHGHPRALYPGSGFETETGTGAGEGFTLNIPFMPGATDRDYARAYEDKVVPRIDEFEPDCIIISAGFDAHGDDPLAPINLTDAAFDEMSRIMIDAADRHAGGRILSVLEGGYDLDVLRRCVPAHVRALI